MNGFRLGVYLPHFKAMWEAPLTMFPSRHGEEGITPRTSIYGMAFAETVQWTCTRGQTPSHNVATCHQMAEIIGGFRPRKDEGSAKLEHDLPINHTVLWIRL